ncbi:DUF4392 domain-containing protein [Bowmanella denitrificans]|uniref:DUF4392 domain-containing protein n=1 Tax=Bowmanella denitrificans TaxID=366582 RepID=A0ABN0WJM1_9ALTE
MVDALLPLSRRIEDLLVSRNIRGMQHLQAALRPGYLLRAAMLLDKHPGTILIGTGFPVTHTFETDGPVGAIALYNALSELSYQPVLVCGEPLYSALNTDFRCIRIRDNDLAQARLETRQVLDSYRPSLVLCIERPGLSADGRYYNMRKEDISDRCACFDYFLTDAACPSIAIGDGGNEIGMGKVLHAMDPLNIIPSVTDCDELIVADVSNWAAYGILAMLGTLRGLDLLASIDPQQILSFLSSRGSVDGVTRQNTLTEDSLCFSAGVELIQQIRQIQCQG